MQEIKVRAVPCALNTGKYYGFLESGEYQASYFTFHPTRYDLYGKDCQPSDIPIDVRLAFKAEADRLGWLRNT